ncbi:MAG: DUF853 family protein, partial [Nitrospirae bacterium]|nr:DUF853 family protein [Nitrospirota bacterium]
IVDFGSLPQPGKRSGFIGKVAETGIRTFIDLDKLQTHTLIAGATGSGKTIAAQDIVEEALLKGISVVVFDPTAQWTGFLRKCSQKAMLRRYAVFEMKHEGASAFSGMIYNVSNPMELIDIKKFSSPGEITVFNISKLDPKGADLVVESTIQQVFKSSLEESAELKMLVVYDEVHRLLPKFGGSGRGFIQLERGAREFRKWGIGLVLISQVLSDFVGEIKANIGTELQMRTRYENDLERIKMKYGEDIQRSAVKEAVGTGMIVNAEYNRGKPYFVSFRPVLHSVSRLTDKELELYDKYAGRILDIDYEIRQLKGENADVFDLNLELKLAKSKVMLGSFNMADIYLESIEPKLKEAWRRLGKSPKKREVMLVDRADIDKSLKEAKREREKFARDEEHMPFDRSLLTKPLEPKNLYIISEKHSETSFELFKHNLSYGYKGICITRTNPDILRKKQGIQNAEFYWLTAEKEESSISPSDLKAIFDKIK